MQSVGAKSESELRAKTTAKRFFNVGDSGILDFSFMGFARQGAFD